MIRFLQQTSVTCADTAFSWEAGAAWAQAVLSAAAILIGFLLIGYQRKQLTKSRARTLIGVVQAPVMQAIAALQLLPSVANGKVFVESVPIAISSIEHARNVVERIDLSEIDAGLVLVAYSRFCAHLQEVIARLRRRADEIVQGGQKLLDAPVSREAIQSILQAGSDLLATASDVEKYVHEAYGVRSATHKAFVQFRGEFENIRIEYA